MHKLFAATVLTSLAMVSACESSGESEPVAEETVDLDEDRTTSADTALMLDSNVAEGAEGVTSTGASTSFDPDCIITETGVAGIESPATLGDFVEAFPADTVLSFVPNYMVDFGSICARADGEDAICAIFESYDVEEYGPDIEVMTLGAYAPQCHTAEGVGPGSPIADAVEAYGAARFGFSYENESREYVSFEEAPTAYSFRASSETAEADQSDADRPGGRFGGDYTGVEGDSYFETDVAHPDARIWEVWISMPL